MTDSPTRPSSTQVDRAGEGQGRRTRSVNRSERRGEQGAASAEYAAVTAAGVGLGGVLIRLLTSEFGQELLQRILDFFLNMIGIG